MRKGLRLHSTTGSNGRRLRKGRGLREKVPVGGECSTRHTDVESIFDRFMDQHPGLSVFLSQRECIQRCGLQTGHSIQFCGTLPFLVRAAGTGQHRLSWDSMMDNRQA